MVIYLLFENKKKNAKVLFADLAHFTMAWIYKQKDTAELQ